MVKKKSAKKKSIKKNVRKTTVLPESALTLEHKSVIKAVEQLNKKLARNADQITAVMARIKAAKTPLTKNKAKDRLGELREVKVSLKKTLKDTKQKQQHFEKEARDLLVMLAAKEKALKAFEKRWEADYLKRQARLKRKAQDRAKKRALAAKNARQARIKASSATPQPA